MEQGDDQAKLADREDLHPMIRMKTGETNVLMLERTAKRVMTAA
jgi:hypothetical protein